MSHRRGISTLLLLMSVMLVSAHAASDVFSYPKTADELAKTLLAEPAKEISRAQMLRGQFIHRKYLSEIPAPLEATGEFLFLRERGLYWHTLKPFESIFVLTPTTMLQKDEGGVATKMNATDQPAVRAAANIFMALFAVDLKSLSNEFNLFGMAVTDSSAKQKMANGIAWQLGLRPKNPAMSAIFSQAIISGAAQVKEVELLDAHGDRTVIQLKDAELLLRQPTAQERALLAY